jgi:Spy/CpxP family protein refolding chaperone
MRPFAATLAVLVLAAATTLAVAQGGPPPGGGPGGGPGHHHMGGFGPEGFGGPGGPGFERNLFPPDLILSNQDALGLTDDQIAAIKKLLNDTHSKTLDVHVDLQRATERLTRATEPAKVDEAAALAAADQAMTLESQVKRLHLALMIRIKNLLTEDQQAKAAALRQDRRREAPQPEPQPDPQP